jgi:hypothetical protein
VSDYIKRLEGIVAFADQAGVRLTSVSVEDLRSLLSDVERMRGALEKIIALVGDGGSYTDYDAGVLDGHGDAADIARQALSAPNTEEGE